MCKIYAFPERIMLTPELVERSKKLARDYTDVLLDATDGLLGEDYTMEELEEVTNLILDVYTKELVRYVESLEEGL